MNFDFGEINDQTGFANGATFEDAAEVRDYFTPESQERMFGDEALVDAKRLRDMAETVIRNRWHMASTEDEVASLRRKVGAGAGRDVVARLAELLALKRAWVVRFESVAGGAPLWAGPPRRSVNSGTLSEHGTVALEKDARKFRSYEDAEAAAEDPGASWTAEVVEVHYRLGPPRFRDGDKVKWFDDVAEDFQHPRGGPIKRHFYRDVVFGEVVGWEEDEAGRVYLVRQEALFSSMRVEEDALLPA